MYNLTIKGGGGGLWWALLWLILISTKHMEIAATESINKSKSIYLKSTSKSPAELICFKLGDYNR
jgi:hypothetical protein